MAPSTTDVYLYVPNLIGYMRAILTIAFIHFSLTDWKIAITCYVASFAGDLFDGIAARALNQCSNFGAVLDMVVDRCSTACLLVVLSHQYPQYMFGFCCLLVLDFSSHWFHMYCSKGHHKAADSNKDKNIIVRIYYGNYYFFGYCCVGQEFFYVLLYILKSVPDAAFSIPGTELTVTLWQLCFYGMGPAFVFKQIANAAQMCSATDTLIKAEFPPSKKNK
jgi:CDP-diacylglycerol--inositol 3-phosphatidyltransferase